MRFKDKVAIVAGAAGGIGRAIAMDLAAEGANTIIWDFNEAGAKETAEKANAKGGKAIAVKMDCLDYAAVNAGVQQVVKDFGKLDIMICTIGGGKMAMFDQVPMDWFKQQVDFQIVPVANCAHAALGPMKEKDYGYMLFFISSVGGTPALPGYQAGKAAVESLVKSLATEIGLTKKKVNVNCIMPGTVNTELTLNAFKAIPNGDQMLEAQKAKSPRGDMSKPELVSPVALFLVSDAAQRVTGESVHLF